MIRSTLIKLTLLLPAWSIAQEKDIRITPNWMTGDVRVVRTTLDLRMNMDTVRIHMTGGGSSHMAVKERKKDRSVLTSYYTSDDEPPQMQVDMSDAPAEVQAGMDQAMRMMERLVDSLSRPMRDMRFDLDLGPTGEVTNKPPDEALKLKVLDAMVVSADVVMTELARHEPGMPKPTKPELHHLCDSMYDALMETMRNEIALLLDGYRWSYPTTGTRREPAMIKDVQAPLHPDWPELPAMTEYGFDELDADHAVCRVVLQYDQAALKELLAKDGTKAERVGLSEERVYRFDRRSGWLTHASSSMTMVMDSTSISVVTRSELKPR